jgi:hypothetical protein
MGWLASLRPARRPGSILDGVESAGARAASSAARSDIRHRLARCRSRLARTGLRNRFTQRRSAIAYREGRYSEGGQLPAPSPAPPTGGAHDEVEALHNLVLRSLDDDQAVEVVTIPLHGKSSIADHMVIASGRSTRQVASMAQKLTERIKQELGRNVRIEGCRSPTGC